MKKAKCAVITEFDGKRGFADVDGRSILIHINHFYDVNEVGFFTDEPATDSPMPGDRILLIENRGAQPNKPNAWRWGMPPETKRPTVIHPAFAQPRSVRIPIVPAQSQALAQEQRAELVRTESRYNPNRHKKHYRVTGLAS